MKKTFVKVALLSMMLTSMPLAMTSCKDYDDDITEINGTTSDLTSQIKALQAAIEANQNAAKAAHDAADAAMKAAQDAAAKGDQAEADAQKAMAMAKAAEEAAANAKAEALAEIAKQVEALQALIGTNADNIQKNADAIAALLGRIEGVEQGLGKIDIEGLNQSILELNKALEAVNVQLAALDGYKTRLEALESQYSGLTNEVNDMKTKIAAAEADINELRAEILAIQADILGIKTDITSIKSDIEGINAQITAILSDVASLSGRIATNESKIAANESAIAELRGQLAALSQEISTKIQNAINTIAGVISSRLTSVTLMPDLYVDGIPTIEFKSAEYNALKLVNGKWVETDETIRVSNNSTMVEYRMNPGTIQTSDIYKPKFVSRIATSRAGEVEDDIISVVSASVTSNGTLLVKAGKGDNTKSLNLNGNKIYTVSLKVPIAKEHLFDNETEAHVYSEYTRLSEVYFTPKLHKTSAVESAIPVHFNDSVQVYQSKMNQLVAARVQYNKTLDLNTLVEGCAFVAPDSHSVLTLEELKAYGFDVTFALASHEYNTLSSDKANQQEFARITGTTFTPGSPVPSGFSPANQAAIGKQPIVHVYLVDTKNKKVVDQRYFKVLITRENPAPLKYTITPTKTAELGCNNYSFSVTWDEMTKQVLSQVPENGISKEDFFHRYGAHAKLKTVKVDGVVAPNLANNVTDNVTLDNTGASIPVMTFTLTNAEVGALAQGKTKTYTVTLLYQDPDMLTADIEITFTCSITNNIATPKLGKTDPVKWVNETMKLYPVPYGSANARDKAQYITNILEGRYNPLATGLLSCATWNLDFAKNYTDLNMSFPAGFGGWMQPSAAENLKQVTVWITHGTAGIQHVENEDIIDLAWNARLNGLSVNTVLFGTSHLQIVKPLKDPKLAEGLELSDKPYIQTVALGDKFELRDAFGELVANTTGMPKNLWDYYGVTKVTFGGTAGAIKVTDDTNGSNPRTLAQLNMTADVDVTTNTLTFHNGGAPMQNDCYLQIPVAVSHYWGTLTGKLYIKIKHTL